MADPGDYCELCDLRFSQCVHGRPEPLPPEKPPGPRVKTPPRVPGTRAVAPPVAAARAPRKWTAPQELRPAILATLQEADGELPADEVFVRLEERLSDVLRPGDREPNPQGELRWRAATRKARKSLMDDGFLASAGPGVWRLTEAGRDASTTPED